MKILTFWVIFAFAWVSAYSNDLIPFYKNIPAFSENKIIMECPEVTCSAATLFKGILSNTGSASGGPYDVTGVSLYIYFASGMNIKDLIISKGEVTMVTDEMLGVDIGKMSASEEINLEFWAEPTSTGNFVSLEIVQNEFNPGNDNEFTCNMEYVPCADLKLTKSTEKEFYQTGDHFNFDFIVKNFGPDISENVLVYDDFFSPFELVNYPDFCTLNTNSNALTCMLGDLGPGEIKSFSVETTVEFPYENTNTATVSSDTNDPIMSNNTSSTFVSFDDAKIDLEVSIDSDWNKVNVGQELNYSITVKNKGGEEAVNVKLTNKLPYFIDGAGRKTYHLEIITPPPGCSTSTTEIVCEIPTLGPGEEKKISYQAYATASRSLENYAEAYAESPDEEYVANNYDYRDVNVRGDYTSNGGNENEAYAGDPVSTYSGEFFFSEEEDLIQFGIMNLVFDRYYASKLHNVQYSIGNLGKNWSHNYDWRLVKDEDGYVEIHSYKGKVFVFEPDAEGWSIINHPPKFQLASESGKYHFGDLEKKAIYTFDENGQLIEISLLNGLGVKLFYEGNMLSMIEDSFGRQLNFTYNGDGLISSISNGVQNSNYEYVNGLLTSSTLGNSKTIRYSYDALNEETGLLAQRMDYDDQLPQLSQEYGSFGEVLKQTDILGNEYTFVYDSLKTKYIEPGDRVTVYEFDNIGTIQKITSPRGHSTKISHGAGNFRKTENAQGLPFDQFYNSQNGLIEKVVIDDDEINLTFHEVKIKGLSFYLPATIEYPDGSMKVLSYDGFGNLTKLVTLGGDALDFQYVNDQLISNLFINDQPLYNYEYNEVGQITTVSDFEGSAILFEYDQLGRRTITRTAEQILEAISYNTSHLPISIIEGEDEFKLEYTSFDAVSKLTFPDESSITYLYDEMRRKQGWIDSKGDTMKYSLDYAGNIISLKERGGSVLEVDYDESFNIISLSRNGLEYAFNYNDIDQLSSFTFPGGQKIDLDLRTDGLVNSYKVDGINAGSYQYDENNRLEGLTLPSGKSQKIKRGSDGSIKQVMLSNEVLASFESIGLDKYTEITDPNGGVWEIEYRSDLLPVKAKNPLGEELAYEYDDLKRITKIQGSTNTTSIAYGSNNLPEILTYSDGESIGFQYDEMNRLTKSKALEIAYDPNGIIIESNGIVTERDKEGRITKIKYDESFEVNYFYSSMGQLIKISDSKNNEYNFDFHENQLVKSIGRSNNSSTFFEYNGFNQVSRISEENLTSNSELALTYNEDGKLIQVSKNNGFYPIVETDERSFEYNPGHQLTSVNYNEAGNAESSELAEFEWNEAGDLMKVSKDGEEQSYQYDVFGNRVSKTVGSTKTGYIHNYAQGKAQIAIIKREAEKSYIVSDPAGRLLYQVDSMAGETEHFHFDERDNTSFITDQTGSIIQGYSYSPFGEISEMNAEVVNEFSFLGRWSVIHDKEPGLIQMHKRYYDQQSKRFLSRDQDTERLDPRLINPYVYSPQDPINYIDPDGNTPKETQENDLQFTLNGVIGTLLFGGSSVSTGLPIGFEAPKLPNFGGGVIKGAIDFIAGSPGTPGSFSFAGKALENAKDAEHTARAAGIFGNTDIKTSQTNVALKNGKKASWWKTGGKVLNVAGNVLTVVNVGVALDKTKDNINGAENRGVDNINASANTLSVQVDNLLDLLCKGIINKDVFNRRYKEVVETYNLANSSSKIIFFTEISLEAADGLAKSLEALLPNPTNFSLSEGIYGLFGFSSDSFR